MLGPRLLGGDDERPALDLLAVELHGVLDAALVGELDEGGALRMARLHVLDDGDAHDLAARDKRVAQLLLARRVVHIADVDGERVVVHFASTTTTNATFVSGTSRRERGGLLLLLLLLGRRRVVVAVVAHRLVVAAVGVLGSCVAARCRCRRLLAVVVVGCCGFAFTLAC